MSDTEDNTLLPKPEGTNEDFNNEADNDNSPNDRRRDDRMEEEDAREDNDRDNAEKDESNENTEKREREPRGERIVTDELRRKRVFVGNLSFQTSWQKLKDTMRKVGKVERVDIFENRSGESKGFGLVQFSTEEEASNAIREMNQTSLDGRMIFVRKDDPNSKDAFPKEKRQDRERRGSPLRRRSPRRRSYSRSRSRSGDRDRRRRDDRGGRRSRSRSNERRDYRRDKDDYRRRSRERRDSRSRDRRSRSKDRERRDSRDERRDRDRDDRRGGDRKTGRGDGFQVIVKNMPYSVTWQQLKDAFREYGKVLRAEVPSDDKVKGRSKGFGYVKFETEKDALKAIDGMHGAAFNDRKIQVEMCHPN